MTDTVQVDVEQVSRSSAAYFDSDSYSKTLIWPYRNDELSTGGERQRRGKSEGEGRERAETS